jgi:hypothetical protein
MPYEPSWGWALTAASRCCRSFEQCVSADPAVDQQATVDDHDLARDEGGVGAGQPRDGPRDLCGLGVPVEHGSFRARLDVRDTQGFEPTRQLGVREPGRDCIGPDPERRPFDGQDPGHRLDRCLGRRVGQPAGRTHVGIDRGDAHDGGSFGGPEELERCLAHPVHPSGVHVDHHVPIGFGQLGRSSWQRDARVIDQDVEVIGQALDDIDRPRDGGAVGHVAFDGGRHVGERRRAFVGGSA